MRVCLYVYMCLTVDVSMYMSMFVFMYICTYVCVHVCVPSCMHACMYVCMGGMRVWNVMLCHVLPCNVM